MLRVPEVLTAISEWEGRAQKSVLELRVGNGTPVKELSTAILRYLEEGKRISISVIGANALSQAVKAVGHAQGELGQQGRVLFLVPAFSVKEVIDRDSGKPIDLTSLSLIVGSLPIFSAG